MGKIIETIRTWHRKRKMEKRRQNVLDRCGCIAYCPYCRDPLNDQAEWQDYGGSGEGRYTCSVCNGESTWHYGIAPGPVLLREED